MRNRSLSAAVFAVVVTSLATAGCAVSEDDLASAEVVHALDTAAAATPAAFVLSITTELAPQDQVRITSSDGRTDPCIGSCNFAYLAGSNLTITFPFGTSDRPNCLRFQRWTGACAGQGSRCRLTINSNLVTEAVWVPILGCNPL